MGDSGNQLQESDLLAALAAPLEAPSDAAAASLADAAQPDPRTGSAQSTQPQQSARVAEPAPPVPVSPPPAADADDAAAESSAAAEPRAAAKPDAANDKSVEVSPPVAADALLNAADLDAAMRAIDELEQSGAPLPESPEIATPAFDANAATSVAAVEGATADVPSGDAADDAVTTHADLNALTNESAAAAPAAATATSANATSTHATSVEATSADSPAASAAAAAISNAADPQSPAAPAKGLKFKIGKQASETPIATSGREVPRSPVPSEKVAAAESATVTSAAERIASAESSTESVTPLTSPLFRAIRVVTRGVEQVLESIHGPIRKWNRGALGLIGSVSLVTIVMSLLAMVGFPILMPARDAITYLDERLAALRSPPADAKEGEEGADGHGGGDAHGAAKPKTPAKGKVDKGKGAHGEKDAQGAKEKPAAKDDGHGAAKKDAHGAADKKKDAHGAAKKSEKKDAHGSDQKKDAHGGEKKKDAKKDAHGEKKDDKAKAGKDKDKEKAGGGH